MQGLVESSAVMGVSLVGGGAGGVPSIAIRSPLCGGGRQKRTNKTAIDMRRRTPASHAQGHRGAAARQRPGCRIAGEGAGDPQACRCSAPASPCASAVPPGGIERSNTHIHHLWRRMASTECFVPPRPAARLSWPGFLRGAAARHRDPPAGRRRLVVPLCKARRVPRAVSPGPALSAVAVPVECAARRAARRPILPITLCDMHAQDSLPDGAGIRLAVDVGGTFTDTVLLAGARRYTSKVLTTPGARERRHPGVQELLASAGLTLAGSICSSSAPPLPQCADRAQGHTPR